MMIGFGNVRGGSCVFGGGCEQGVFMFDPSVDRTCRVLVTFGFLCFYCEYEVF